ncbi:MAG: AsmA family protein [Candidatus Omnitrophota bacterium]|nr:AsmA family protein [Candidatus Omnitrophota bacterium]
MKKFIIITLVLLLILAGGIIYLNKVILPVKIKSLIVSTLKKQTGKDVTLKSVKFSIFSGLILRDLVISDTQNVILSTRQATCSIFIWPILKKQIIIPGITLKSPYIFLERKSDGSFNLQDLFASSQVPAKKSDFSVSVLKISVSSGNLVFQDDTLATKFKKEIKNIQFNLYLSLPASVKFNFKGEIAYDPVVFISASGQYKILTRELSSNIAVKNLQPAEFASYYNNLSNLVAGLIDLQAQVNLKDQILQADINAKGQNLALEKDKLKAKLNSEVQIKVEYNLPTNKIIFDGFCNIWQADITGLDLIGEIKNLNGKFSFNQRSLVADGLKAELLGVPFEIKLSIKDFNTPVLNLDTNFYLSNFASIAKEKFNFSLINSATGKAVLSLKVHPDKSGIWAAQGELGITGASLKLDKLDQPVEDITGVIGFSQQGLNWKDTKFKYQGLNYESSGTLSDFKAPGVNLKLFSEDLSLGADFNLLDKKIKVNQFKGKYFDSQFLISGDIDISDLAFLKVDLGGNIIFELGKLGSMLDKQYPAIKSLQPAGQLEMQFNFNGNPSDYKNCYLQAKFTSSNFSLYGLNAQSFALDFLLDQKIVKIPAVSINFYDGLIQGNGALNLDTANLPYQLELVASGIKLEKLKMDTASKNKNISGTLLGELKLIGYSDDLGKLGGNGSFSILEGNLWEFNLLQGLGKIMFTKDMGNIKFSECTSNFLIKDKSVYTNNLKLNSNVCNFTGPLKIGFDGSLEGVLDVEILSEMVPISGTFKDITTAIAGGAGKFGIIKLSGTLKEPKYNFKPAVTNIIKGLADVLFGK